jgi:nicotinate-nucleotide adenylyltransferase
MRAKRVTVERHAIGILGSMFDPVHYGHLRIALEVLEGLPLKEVRMLPCGDPPHREAPEANASQRLQMLKLAIGGQTDLCVDERELTRSGPSYMVDSLASIREEVGDVPLCLILGTDAFMGLPRWHQWQQLFDYGHVIVTHRPGYKISGEMKEILGKRECTDRSQLFSQSAGFVCLMEVTQLDISSSKIRGIIKTGTSPRYLLPDSVLDFINEENLYS